LFYIARVLRVHLVESHAVLVGFVAPALGHNLRDLGHLRMWISRSHLRTDLVAEEEVG
jgi:hypothetical protein